MRGNIPGLIPIFFLLFFTGGLGFGFITVPPSIEHPILFRGFMLLVTLCFAFIVVKGVLPQGSTPRHRNFGIPRRDQE